MSTRACVCFGDYGAWQVFYRHCDGYPTGLGFELAEALKQGLNRGQIIKTLNLEDYNRTVREPEECFLRIQGDLDYIYAVRTNYPKALTIYRTSNPWLSVNFVFPVWACLVCYFPVLKENLKKEMRTAEQIAQATIRAIASYHKALNQK